ncbi:MULTISPECIES: D-ribose pyranase [Vagococcus]|uniref:D-ribose pyranase n=1 Tax=Vagococcus TaxID=2737 RepID=UPI000EE76848|nr:MULTISPECIES: D-ribose pyranase [Vagococcus]MDT2807958.1 D-ribose pyranase [Vagococcus lutrae]HCT95486.1 D-ribose pyranase [Vagococcus sp.]
MKKHGILNSEISKVLADLGHTDQLIIADAGLPVPKGVKKIDVALTLGTPDFLTVLDCVMDDMAIEKITLANEIVPQNPEMAYAVQQRFSEDMIDWVSHETLKEQSQQAVAVIRTGEATPFANVILHAGVLF